MENPPKNGWFGGTPISGNLHMCVFEYKILYILRSVDLVQSFWGLNFDQLSWDPFIPQGWKVQQDWEVYQEKYGI